MLFKEWIGLNPKLVREEKELGEVDKFCYFNKHISPGGRISEEVLPRIQNIR